MMSAFATLEMAGSGSFLRMAASLSPSCFLPSIKKAFARLRRVGVIGIQFERPIEAFERFCRVAKLDEESAQGLGVVGRIGLEYLQRFKKVDGDIVFSLADVGIGSEAKLL